MAANRDRQRQAKPGKSLFGRIEPNRIGSRKRSNKKQGLSVVNGRLVSSNDVGVLLREASRTVEARKTPGGRRRAVKVTQGSTRKRAKPGPVITTTERNGNRHNKLVISTSSDVTDKLLLFNNLELGVNQESLKSVLEELSNTSIARVRVRDLPSGSATANVWLARPTAEELERVRKFFDGALVDGRTIKVSTVADSDTKLSY
ncbi:hypothetical protein HG536_0D02900 [Torulaspora globosa]|uniref:RRM domain-containing protein n=1 Tax=Torulaspora globosa TaxID=48254 RepID=A0A7G3ZGY2_9SACH|nr:uncharacterized protein HG536_0D02900 [Torulaspora globosa]QLL32768.1 hypothetical protein HG536_0D02900 [Torulaspora globosa]